MKKGELTSAQIIALVMAVIGFLVVLFLLWSLEFPQYSEEELCRLSVLSRATSPAATAGLIPLKCTTKKICITSGNGKCDSQFIGEEVSQIKISRNNPSEAARIIEKTSADAMYNCWKMMGEGKLDLFSGAAQPTSVLSQLTDYLDLKKIESACLICSRIAIDKDVSNEYLNRIINEGKLDINIYMQNTKVQDSSLSYLEALTDRTVGSYPAGFQFEKESATGSREMGVLFFQIKTEKGAWEAFTDTSVKTGAFIIAGGGGLGIVGKVLTIKGAIVTATLTLGTGAFAAWQTSNNRAVSAGYCGPYSSSKDSAGNGCSLVTGFDYNNIQKINEFCGRIEGNP